VSPTRKPLVVGEEVVVETPFGLYRGVLVRAHIEGSDVRLHYLGHDISLHHSLVNRVRPIAAGPTELFEHH
jgi:hypothetical protein